ncbi:MAG: AI-2E family transporter [Oscillospiraceae bacterium]|nr:AI-2E family transporter [Oscillospiraceae bacterium]
MKRRFSGPLTWLGAFALGLALIFFYKLVNSLPAVWGIISGFISILEPFVIGFIIAFLLHMPVKKLAGLLRKIPVERLSRASYGIAVAIVYLVLAGAVTLFVLSVVPSIVSGVTGLIKSIPEYKENVVKWVAAHAENPIIRYLDPLDNLEEFFEYLSGNLSASSFQDYIDRVMSFTSSISVILLGIISSIYMLLTRESLAGNLKTLLSAVLPARWMRLLVVYGRKTADIFNSYLYTKILDSLLVGILLFPVLILSGLPYPVLLAILGAIFNLIPYFGSIIMSIFCVVIGLLSGNPGGAIAVFIYNTVLQQIDANLIQPKLIGTSVGIKPFYVLVAITVGGGLFGIPGVLLGVPLMAVLQVMLRDGIDYLRKKQKAKNEEQEETAPD